MEEELIEYLCTAPCLALVGSGPSADCGLPTWRTLAEQILERIQARSLPDKQTEAIETAFAQGTYPLMFERVAKCKPLGDDFLYKNCIDLLTPSDTIGEIYDALVRMPIRAYFTTNFDDLLSRHLERAGLAPIPLKNTPADLAKVDVDTLSGYVIKLHGDFAGDSSLVLTEAQYDAVCFDPQFTYLRQFIQSYLLSRHFLIVRYSVRDPDIQGILKMNTFLFKRSTPIYALIANATAADVDEWDRKYNIRLIPYRASGTNHSQLRTLLKSLNDYVTTESLQPRRRLSIELRAAQSLYMWHKFQVQPQPDVRLDAFKALLLSIAVQKMSATGIVTKAELQAECRTATGIGGQEIEENLQKALDAACRDGFLAQTDSPEHYSVPKNTVRLVNKFGDQYNVLSSTFREQTKIDFRTATPQLSESELSNIADTVVEAVTNIFSERGIEVVNMIFAGQQPRLVGAAGLFRMILSNARRLQKPASQYAFVHYVTRLLSNPTSNQEHYLEYLSKAFVCIQALSMDPDGSRFRREFLSNRTLLVDDNVLIPLLAVEGSKFKFFDSLLKAALKAGLRLVTTSRAVDEVYDHLTWARSVVANNHGNPTEILGAALGHGRYRKNAFLDGWVRYAEDRPSTSFSTYLEAIFGEDMETRYVERRLLNEYRIDLMGFNDLAARNQEAFVVREEVEHFIAQKAQEREIPRSEHRMKAEAEVYTYLYFWQELAPDPALRSDWKSSFLSQGGFLNWIAQEGPYPLGRAVVVSSDALYELLVRLGETPTRFASFADVLHSSYLYSADYFVDRVRYGRFFGSLINEAERVYGEGLDAYRQHIDDSLTADFITQVEPLERPLLVDRLQTGLKAGLAELNRKYRDVVSEKEVLQRQLVAEQAKSANLAGRTQRMKKYGERVAKRLQRRRKRK